MSIEIRNARAEEYPAFIEALSAAFLERPDIARVTEAVTPWWDPDRTWAAFDGGRVCGTFRSWATKLTVPGGACLPAAAVAAVTVLPTHRRRGILRGMTAAEHAAVRERGEAVGLLYASEYRIYGRFGYGPACRVATWTLDALATSFHGDPVSGVELVVPDTTVRDAVEGVFEAWRARQPGELRRRPFRWNDELGLHEPAWGETWKGLLALHRDAAGIVDGYARYQPEGRFEQRQPRGRIKLNELHALTDEAYRSLWRFLAETDLVSTVTAEGRSPAERLPWLLTNHRAAAVSDVGEGLWVRLFDVARALEARTYEHEADLVLEVVDDELDAPLRLALEASSGGATCRPTDRSPDLTLPVSALGAAYLGGTRLRDVVIGTGADEHRPGALAAADALFRTADEPWCSTFF
jgi:predicted acetyltransferase